MHITWTKLPLSDAYSDALTRSSHSLAIVKDSAYLFGGELTPRKPVDAHLYTVDLKTGQVSRQIFEPENAPAARVGATFSAATGSLWLWGGRGGKDIAALPSTMLHLPIGLDSDSDSDSDTRGWSALEPQDALPITPRSFHTSAVIGDTIYIHAGCPTKGRSTELHSYTPSTGAWKALRTAPEPARGGTALAVVQTADSGPVLARYGGFAGYELAGPLHFYLPSEDRWVEVAVSGEAPPARSVHGFVGLAEPLKCTGGEGDGSEVVALCFYGESESAPPELGHDGAGKFHSDTWALLRSYTDSHTSNTSYSWKCLETHGAMSPRGWFACAPWTRHGKTSAVVHGGLNDRNERLGDMWVLEVHA
ncbi:hypothetical protein B0H19DRAFT_1160348 [Mycena capillaripes]|nr:hypothetical protein B0H19DRAFT_1160348 [Mycena capillaripes]